METYNENDLPCIWVEYSSKNVKQKKQNFMKIKNLKMVEISILGEWKFLDYYLVKH